MGYGVKLQQFEGPLDLLLDLIEKDKLDISQLSLATVTDDYLKHLDANPEIPPEELADFLTVAAKLLYIKSQALLPFLNFGDSEEEEEGGLEDQLKIYREYVIASQLIESAIGRKRFLYVHDKLPNIEVGFAPPKKLSFEQMQAFMRSVILRLEPVIKTPNAVIEKTVSIHEKINRIRNLISRCGNYSFRAVLEEAESRVEVVVCFLALLEMIKQKTVVVNQSELFEDITITGFDQAKTN